MRGPKAAWTSEGLPSAVRSPGVRARSRRVSSKADTRRAALARPTPGNRASSATSRDATPDSEPYAASISRATSTAVRPRRPDPSCSASSSASASASGPL